MPTTNRTNNTNTTRSVIIPPPTDGSSEPEGPVTLSGEPAAQKFIRDVVYFILAVLFVGFLTALISVITIWVQSLKEKSASYEELKTQIIQQRNDIDIITKGLQVKHIIQ